MRKRARELRVRIDEGIMDALKEIAKEEGRTVSELVREAVAWLVRDRELQIKGEERDGRRNTGALGDC